MMKIEDQVCSLELAKKLKELGVKQESLFYWSKLSIQNEYNLELRTNIFNQEIIFADCTDYISAFSVGELGEFLPKELRINNMSYYYTQMTDITGKIWICFYRNSLCELKDAEGTDEIEVNARAKILIYLIENNLIKFNDEKELTERFNGQV